VSRLCESCLTRVRGAVKGALALVPVTSSHATVDAHADLDGVRSTREKLLERLRAEVIFMSVQLENSVS
jgi:hypothetical protein